MSATLAEIYFSEREARARDAAGLFDATRDSGAFVDQLKVWMGRKDLPGRANVEMRYLFRGHADSRWGLSSTLYRTVTSAGGAYDERLLRQAERAIVKQMRSEGLGRNLTDGEMLIVLQHHAIPTRLIDTTESPRVALHFACAGQEGVDGRLFVLAQRQAADGEFPSTALKDSQLLPWGVKRPRGSFALSRWQEAVVCVDDDPLDPRMKAQQGRFLVGGLIRRLAGDGISVGGKNLSATDLRHLTTLRILFPLPGAKKHAGTKWPALGWTVRIPAEWKPEIRDRLASDGVTDDHLFPDFDGSRRLARFVAVNAEALSGPKRIKVPVVKR